MVEYTFDSFVDNLVDLELNNCSKLKEIILSHNDRLAIGRFDLTYCKELLRATICEMKITELSMEDCKKLSYLSVRDNDLKELNIRGCNNLEDIVITGNTLKRLDVPECKVWRLDCRNNYLEELCLPDCMSELDAIICENNKLSSMRRSVI